MMRSTSGLLDAWPNGWYSGGTQETEAESAARKLEALLWMVASAVAEAVMAGGSLLHVSSCKPHWLSLCCNPQRYSLAASLQMSGELRKFMPTPCPHPQPNLDARTLF